MQDSDGERFARAIALLEELFDKHLSEVALEVYFKALSDLSIEQVEAAASKALSSMKWFPKPVELRDLAQGSADDHAERAWNLFQLAMRQIGYYTSLYCQDQALAQAIVETFCGWTRAIEVMNDLSPEMTASKRKEFMANFRLARKSPRRDIANYLPGFYEQQNQQNAASWSRGQIAGDVTTELIDGKGVVVTREREERKRLPYKQLVGVIAGKEVMKIEMEFDGNTGRLTDGSIKALSVLDPVKQLESAAQKQLSTGEGTR